MKKFFNFIFKLLSFNSGILYNAENKSVGELIRVLKQFNKNYEVIISDTFGHIATFDTMIYEDNKKVVILTKPYPFLTDDKKIIECGD